jgi:poly(beta-D-mannuronate) lyase
VAFRAGNTAAHHCRLTRCSILNYSPPDKKSNTKWVSLYGTHNRVDHCIFGGKTNGGQTLVVWLSGEPNHHRIDHNHFGRRPPLGFNGGETIRVGTSDWSMSDSHTTVEYNLFEECNGEIEIVSNKSCRNTYRYNTFVNCEGALTLRHGNRCAVEGNFFFGNHKAGTGGVRVIGEDHIVVNNYFAGLAGEGSRSALTMMNGIPDSPLAGYLQVKRALIEFNTFVDCYSGILIGRVSDDPKGGILPPKDCVFCQQHHRRPQSSPDRPEDAAGRRNLVRQYLRRGRPGACLDRRAFSLRTRRWRWRPTARGVRPPAARCLALPPAIMGSCGTTSTGSRARRRRTPAATSTPGHRLRATRSRGKM